MLYEYSELIAIAKWDGVQAARDSMKATVLAEWGTASDRAGFKIQGKITEILTTLWMDPNTNQWSDIAIPGVTPEAYKYTVSANVVPK